MSKRLYIQRDFVNRRLTKQEVRKRRPRKGAALKATLLSSSTIFVGLSLYPVFKGADADNVIDNINKISEIANPSLASTALLARPVINSHYIIGPNESDAKTVDVSFEEVLSDESIVDTLLEDSSTETALAESAAEKPAIEKVEEVVVAKPKIQSITDENGLNLTISVEKGDTLSSLFEAVGLSGRLAFDIARIKENKALNRIKVGDALHFQLTPDFKLKELRLQINPVDSLVIKQAEDGKIVTSTEAEDIEWRTRAISGTINGSFSGAAQKAGLTGTQISELAGIYKWDMDFALDVRKGDQFIVILEEGYVGDTKVRGKSKILAAEYDGAVVGQLTAIRFEHPDGEVSFYTPEGRGFQKAFLRAPLNYRRISSNFTPKRYHPILKKWRSHNGTDFAASRGEPVSSTASGKIIYIGRKGGYGKTIIIKHQDGITTLYSHLNGYKNGLSRGDRVRQGELIGYVGSTGLATGPHLHYEFRVNNKQVDAMKVPLPRVSPIDGEELAHFKADTKRLLPQIAALRVGDNSELVAANGNAEKTTR